MEKCENQCHFFRVFLQDKWKDQNKSKSTEAATDYSPNFRFLKRNWWPKIHVSGVYFYRKLPLKYMTWVSKKMGGCTVISLIRKTTLFAVSDPHWPKTFLKPGPECVILIDVTLGFILLYTFHCPPHKQPSLLCSSSPANACFIPSDPLLLLAHIWFQLEDAEQGVWYSARAYSSGKEKRKMTVVWE